jgi:hypothetical protein
MNEVDTVSMNGMVVDSLSEFNKHSASFDESIASPYYDQMTSCISFNNRSIYWCCFCYLRCTNHLDTFFLCLHRSSSLEKFISFSFNQVILHCSRQVVNRGQWFSNFIRLEPTKNQIVETHKFRIQDNLISIVVN